jgi:hypothetical protein
MLAGNARAQNDELHPTGYLEPTPAQQEWMDRHMLEVKRVKLNQLGLKRVEDHRRKRGFEGTGRKAVKFGYELEGTVGGTMPGEVTAESMMASVAEATTSTTVESTAATEFVVYADALAADSLPSAVDNSLLDSFPPVGSQHGGACVQFATVYYTLTHMTAMARGWDAKHGGSAYWFSPEFTYNMVNGGDGGGSTFQWDMMINNGCARWSLFPDSANYTEWPMNPEAWRDALSYRADEAWVLNRDYDPRSALTHSNALAEVKAMLNNGYTINFSTYAYSWEWGVLGDNPSTISDDAFVGESVCHCVNGTAGSHALTWVGYNDDLWCDVNANGVVDEGETGALKVCNSWGDSWRNDGFAWVLYDALLTTSAITNAPDRTNGVFVRGYGIVAREVYTPRMLARVTMNHAARQQVNIAVGANDGTVDVVATNYCITYDGGNLAFDGGTQAVDGVFYFDVSDAAPSDLTDSAEYYVEITDSTSGDSLTVDDVSFVDVEKNIETICAYTPMSYDNATIRFSATYRQSTGSNHAPRAYDQEVSLQEDASVDVSLVATDPDGDNVAIEIVEYPQYGTLTGSGTQWLYTPASEYNGRDHFMFRGNDGTDDGNRATVNIKVTSVWDNPVVLTSPQSGTDLEDGAVITLEATSTDADVDAGTLTQIRFYSGAQLLAEQTSAPYSCTLSNVTVGTYAFSAVGTFASGAVLMSDGLTLNVTDPSWEPASYADAFDCDGLSMNNGTGGGMEATVINTLEFSDGGNLTASQSSTGTHRAEVHTTNAYSMVNGFALYVTYNVDLIETELADTATFGLIEEVDDLDGLFFGDSNGFDGIGVSLTTRSDDGVNLQGLNGFDSDGTPRLSLCNDQVITAGSNKTCCLTVSADGTYSYSIDGAVASTGTTSLDLSREYHFAAYTQRDAGFAIQNVALYPHGEPDELFGDTFNRDSSSDLNASASGKYGTLGALNYTARTFDEVTLDISDNALRINGPGDDASYGGLVYINDHNFVDAAIADSGGFSISVDLAAYTTLGSTRWMAVGVGQSLAELDAQSGAAPVDHASDLLVAYRQTTDTLEIYKNGVLDSEETITGTLPHASTTMRIVYFLSGFDVESTVAYAVYFDGSSSAFTSGTFTWSGTDENYISLASNLSGDSLFDNLAVRKEDALEDFNAPTPDPMGWVTPPTAVTYSEITMTATTATDPFGVQYCFSCTEGGGHDSGWQDSPIYNDTGLEAKTTYTYEVKARDASVNTNETGTSSAASATTLAVSAIQPIAGVDFENAADSAFDNSPDDLVADDGITVSSGWTLAGNASAVKLDTSANTAGTTSGSFVGKLNGGTVGVASMPSVTPSSDYFSWSITIPSNVVLNLSEITFDLRQGTTSSSSTRWAMFNTSLDGGPGSAALWGVEDPPLRGAGWTNADIDLVGDRYQGLSGTTVTFYWYNESSGSDIDSIVVLGSTGSDGPTARPMTLELSVGTTAGFSWYGEAGLNYGLEVTADLTSGNWQTVTNVAGTNGFISLTGAMDQTNAFYRVYLLE